MKIALVAPQSVPLVLGGAENLVAGLQKAFVDAGHRCDIVTQPSPERSLAEVIESYAAFLDLDLAAYDCVVSGKYPAWMVRHPNHRLYMLHRLRGLYDTYPGMLLASDAPPDIKGFCEVARYGAGDGRRLDARRLIDMARDLASRHAGDPALAYPGPLARSFVHALDDAAIDPRTMRSFAAISATVARREGYFPKGVAVDVLHPPAHRSDYRCGEQRYFFTSSRLDTPKRIALLIEAMRHVEGDLPLLIAGRGPEEERLRALAAGDGRIRFLGYVADDEMPGLYADALAVPFLPFDEDYGLVTLEAMLSSKPVITCRDSGGACELVVDGVNGRIVAPEPKAIGAAMSEMARDPDQARRFGEAGSLRAAGVGWERVAETLVAAPPTGARRKVSKRLPKLVVATTFPVYPPHGGGQSRVFHLYRHLAKRFDIDIVSFGYEGSRDMREEIAPGLIETRVARSAPHQRLENSISKALGDIAVGDVTMPHLASFTPAYGEALRHASQRAEAVIACHPYLLHEIEKATDRPLWYEAQDVEISLKTAVFEGHPGAERVLGDIRRLEGAAWHQSAFAFACTNEDIQSLTKLYGGKQGPALEVPNGVCLDEISYVDWPTRRRLQSRLALGRRRLALFIGSWHPPNIEAVAAIVAMAPSCPDVAFLIAGSACDGYRASVGNAALPQNVRLLGLVSQDMRVALLGSVDVALNPMSYGSGSNLKMLDYFAAGAPVITTPFGARGFGILHERHAHLAPLELFPAAIERVLAAPDDETAALVTSARALTEERYGWNVIAGRLDQAIADLGLLS